MVLSRTVSIIVLLVGAAPALGAEALAKAAAAQHPVRPPAPLPVPAAALARALNLPTYDRSRLMLDAVRLLFSAPDGLQDDTARRRARVAAVLRAARAEPRETVPLPLGPTAWREVLLDRTAQPVEDDGVIAAILGNRAAGLLYCGLAAIDDETLRWLAGERDLLNDIKQTPGTFAAFGRSIRVRDGRVVVPGGQNAAAIWQDIVGESPADPRRFVRSLFRAERGRLAFFYDSIAHLDPSRQRFALGPADVRTSDRARALAAVFSGFARDWEVELRPFARPQLDPWLVMHVVSVDAGGLAAGPGTGPLDQVFRDDAGVDVPFRDIPASKLRQHGDRVDAAWLASRVNSVPYPDGRRRLEAFLFAQRALDAANQEPHAVATVLRAFLSMPMLMLTLERVGIRDVPLLVAAARHAHALNSIGDDESRRAATALFQVSLAFVERGVRTQALARADARALVASLTALNVERGRGYDERIAAWTRSSLFKASPQPPLDAADPVEAAVLALLSGARDGRPRPIVEWEGRRYHADPAAAELLRLQRVRERQGGASIDAAIARVMTDRGAAAEHRQARREFVDTMVSVHYAAHLGDPDGPALAGDNVALRHQMESIAPRPGVRSMNAWRLPSEVFGAGGWRVQGSLLGLDLALRRLALRRLDDSLLPEGPSLSTLDRQIATLAAALMNPHTLTDSDRDRIATALGRGRERFAALRRDPAAVDAFAADAGVSEWRREAIRWALTHDPDSVDGHVSLADLFHAGADADTRGAGLDDWGAAMLPLTGCLCLGMPDATAWENLAGRPAAGALGTRSADVSLRVAETLAKLRLPASLAPGILAFAMQDVTDAANPAYFDDWQAFAIAARSLTEDRFLDYIAALTADGPLVPARGGS